jgi:tRNA-splicing ligase RtcB
MDLGRFERVSPQQWRIPQHGAMRVPAVIYGSKALIAAMDDKVYEQLVNVAALPGIVDAAYAMPDAHWGYGFRSAESPPSIPTRAAWYRRAALASTSRAAYGVFTRA